MSLKFQNENAAVERRNASSKRVVPVKASVQSKGLGIGDANAVNFERKTSKELVPGEVGVPDRNETTKAAQGIRSESPSIPPNVEDIDEDDDENLEFCPDYVKRIYDHLFEEEARHPVKARYLSLHPQLFPKMRMCLIEWLLVLQNRFKLLQDTLLLAVSIMDRLLSTTSIKVDRANFQLFGAACLWVATKYEEMYHPSVKDFVYMCADAYTLRQFLEMEVRILTSLNFEFSKPLSAHFLRRFSKAGGGDLRTHTAAKYLIELSLFCYSLVDRRPSLIAAAALYVAGKVTKKITWDEKMRFYSRCDCEELKPVALRMAKMAVDIREDHYLKTTLKKYSCEKYYWVPNAFKPGLLDELFPPRGSV